MSWLEIEQGGNNPVLLLNTEMRPDEPAKHVFSCTELWREIDFVLARVNCAFGVGQELRSIAQQIVR